MSTQTSALELPYQVLPLVTALPVDGYGGSYYDVQFLVPIYSYSSPEVYRTISWSDIDKYYTVNVSNAIESAVSFGICATTLLNLVALTPQHKRKLPLHGFMCLALIFQTIRNAADMVLVTNGLWVASYISLTVDLEATTISNWFYAVSILNAASACLAFVFVQACFFVQSRALMTWLRMHHVKLFRVLLTSLVIAGAVAMSFRIGLATLQIMHLDTNIQHQSDRILHRGTLIAYGISIGSWSMVFCITAISIILNRRRHSLRGNSIYDTALNLVVLLGLESFIVPILLCVLQLLPVRFVISQPEQLIIPSVLFLLPIGTLFGTAHGGSAPTTTQMPRKSLGQETRDANKPNKLRQGESQSSTARGNVKYGQSESNNVTDPPEEGKELTRFLDPVEVELALIDGLHGS